MSLNRAVFYGVVGLILVASRPLCAQVPSEVTRAASGVFTLWTPGHTVPLSQENYGQRRKWLEANLKSFETRYKINLIELEKCERRKTTICHLSETVRRTSAFVLKGGVVQTLRSAFSWNQTGLSERFASLARQWQEELSDPGLRAQTEEMIAQFIANPMNEAVFLLTDQEGNVVFNSAEDKFAFERYGTVQHFKNMGRVEIGKQQSVRQKQGKKTVLVAVNVPARVYLMNDDLDLDSPKFGGMPWVANDFAQIKIKTKVELPQIETAALEDCQPGAKLFTVGFSAQDKSISITDGKALTMQEFAKHARDWEFLAKFLHGLRGRTYLITDANGEEGMQGGPILTEQGKACGILKEFVSPHTKNSFWLTVPY